MYKKLSLFFSIVFFVTIISQTVYCENYAVLTSGGYAKVLEAIDGDSIKVKFAPTSEIALVRFIGVDSLGYDDALTYLNNTIVGKNVYLEFDGNIPKTTELRWNNMYVTYNGTLINQELIDKGYAKANNQHEGASKYNSLVDNEQRALSNSIGMWKQGRTLNDNYTNYGNYSYYNNYYSGDGININTASSSDIINYLSGVSSSLAYNIINYRENNPFNTVFELKFVPGMTKEIFENNRNDIAVSTNINRATERELRTLYSLSQYEIDRIIQYRTDYNFSTASDIYNKDIISEYKYNQIKNFISTTDTYEIDYTIPDIVVDLNSATQTELESLGLSSGRAAAIIDYRTNHNYKTLSELIRIPDVYFTNDEVNKYEDNLTLNTYSNNQRININTATREQLKNIGLTDDEVYSLYNRRRNMYTSKDIPIDLSSYSDKISLFTNINTASQSELESLGPDMNSSIISEITTYRNNQPFGNFNEIRDFFSSIDKNNIFDSIRNFTVVN